MNIDEVIAKYLKLANNDKCCQKEEAYKHCVESPLL